MRLFIVYRKSDNRHMGVFFADTPTGAIIEACNSYGLPLLNLGTYLALEQGDGDDRAYLAKQSSIAA
jgi:hypothetical protein